MKAVNQWISEKISFKHLKIILVEIEYWKRIYQVAFFPFKGNILNGIKLEK